MWRHLLPTYGRVFDQYEKYFTSEYGYQIMVAFIGDLDYSDDSLRQEVKLELGKFTETEYYLSNENYTESWLALLRNI